MTKHIVPPSANISPETPTPTTTLAGPKRTLSPGYIHLGISKEIAPALREFGLDPDPLIRAAGLDPSLFDDGMSVIPFAALGRLYTLCVAGTNCSHFGLLVGQRATILSLGMVGRLMLHSDTVGDALRALVANLSLQDRAVVPSLIVSDGTALLTFATYQAAGTSAEQIRDAALGVTINIVRTLCGSTWNPVEVLLPKAAPADAAAYRRHFRAPARFNQETATLVFPARDLEQRITGADPMMRALLEEHIQQMKARAGSEFSDDIRRLLRTRLTSNHCSADDIAEVLAMHRRTLSRRLKGTGMGYRALTNEIRFEIARQLLEETDVSLSHIAAALAYSEASAFTRAFRRWSGETPSTWRAERHAA
ncbi:AraC family transcriptional regulator (plasmid) [Microvirga terrae]|uniref:AraC family transcriptional regulator n=1 Tax=Microvirga terrae TaxID=2740529 RepID=A0ABY5S190_9HYPH|nr:AraC family transcriptional regulator [Microvirga terrae]UVF22309.1 AraC family transcriptional regulator [Microvirga terrae]